MTAPFLDHIGIAAHHAGPVLELFNTLFQYAPYKVETVDAQGVRAYFIEAGGAKLELLEAMDSSSPVARFLEKNQEGVHHIAFEVPNIGAAFRRVQELGFAPLTDQPAPGADGKLIFFLHPKQTHGLLIEFCQRTRSPLEPTYIPFDGGKLGVFELGDPTRPPLVILHGAAGCTSMETEPLIRRLSASFRVLALDFAGHGQSDPFADYRFTPELFIENVRTVFDHFGLEQAGLFGFSLGGFIGLSFAALYPERLSRLAVHATNVFWDPPLIETMLKRLDHEQILDQSPDLARYLAEMHGESGWVSLFERMKAYTLDINRLQARYERAGHVNVPTLVSAVDEDDLFSIDSPVDLFKLLPNAKLAILPGKRHAFQNVNLDVLVPLLLRHFS